MSNEINLCGEANETGFYIFDRKNKIYIKTKDYSRTWKKIFIYLIFVVFPINFSMGIFNLNFGLFISISVFLVLLSVRTREKNSCEWHACEHKIIRLLERYDETTLEALIKEPSFDDHCSWGRWQSYGLREPSLEKLKETLEIGNKAKEYYKKLSSKGAI